MVMAVTTSKPKTPRERSMMVVASTKAGIQLRKAMSTANSFSFLFVVLRHGFEGASTRRNTWTLGSTNRTDLLEVQPKSRAQHDDAECEALD